MIFFIDNVLKVLLNQSFFRYFSFKEPHCNKMTWLMVSFFGTCME